jgi:hypothetical protein
MASDDSKQKLDIIIIISAIFNCITIPIEIAFSPSFMDSKAMFFTNLIIDIIFFIDICVTFRTGYIDDTGNEVIEPRHIAYNYLKGVFWIDLVATLPMN